MLHTAELDRRHPLLDAVARLGRHRPKHLRRMVSKNARRIDELAERVEEVEAMTFTFDLTALAERVALLEARARIREG